MIKFTMLVPMIALGGCASLPNTMPALPMVQGFAILPNCVAVCTIHVSIQRAESDTTSTGTGAVTSGAQSQSSSSTSTTSTTKEVEPKP